MLAEAYRPQQHPCAGAQEREVAEHLDDEHDPSGLGFGGDVPEAHRREDGHAEMQRVRADQWLSEVRCGGSFHHVERGDENQQIDGNDKRQRLECPHCWVAGVNDCPNLPYREACEDQEANQ